MKLFVELLLAAAACAVTYHVATPEQPEDSPRVGRSADTGSGDGKDEELPAPAHPGLARRIQRSPREGRGSALTPHQQAEVSSLRNEIIKAATAHMHQRGRDVSDCFDGQTFAGAQKLEFSVEVVSTPTSATTGPWHFEEIVDGEPLPDSFASCAVAALGSDQQLEPPEGGRFPQFSGKLSFIYTVPAPPTSTD